MPYSLQIKIQSVRCPQAPGQSGKFYPLWLIMFWSELANVSRFRERWRQAIQFLEMPDVKLRNSGLSAERSKEVCREIKMLPWDDFIKGFEDQDPLLKLRTYCSRDWLHSSHINHMLEFLRNDLELTATAPTSIQLTYHMEQVFQAYYNGNETYRTK
jgi:hypothetical protein